MEAKLAQYRAEKAKQYQATKPSSILQSIGEFNLFKRTKSAGENKEKDGHTNEDEINYKPIAEESSLHNSVQHPQHSPPIHQTQHVKSRQIILIKRGLKILLWLVLWGLFIELQFGAVYFVVSLLIFVYFNTRTGPKEANKLSAYSVFNPNFETLDGQFTSDQFEQELRYGAGSVH